jgi:hypothetical protein
MVNRPGRLRRRHAVVDDLLGEVAGAHPLRPGRAQRRVLRAAVVRGDGAPGVERAGVWARMEQTRDVPVLAPVSLAHRLAVDVCVLDVDVAQPRRPCAVERGI